MNRHFLLLAFICLSFSASLAQLPERTLDSLVEATMSAFEVPGISLGIVKDGKVVYAKGHGIRSMKNNKKMDANTLVGVASNSKGFTCVAISMLVDEGKIRWDDKVRKYIPEFEMSDSWVTQEFTIRDLVTHRSGLPLGAGDLMFFPEGGDFTVQDVIGNMRHLKPSFSFRSKFMYNNNLYIIAGEVIKRVSGLDWAEFIERRILEPVGMKTSKGSYNRAKGSTNIIDAHARTEGKILPIPHDWHEIANAAGGIMSNIPDMLTWAQFLIDGGVTKDGKRLISEEQMKELWTLQTPLKPRKSGFKSNFRGYGLGWFLSDQDGHLQVRHSGGLLGTVTQFTLLPDIDLGIVVLTNQMEGGAFVALTEAVKDSYLGYKDRDWVTHHGDKRTRWLAYNDSIKTSVYTKLDAARKASCSMSTNKVIGTYRDAWFGDVIIEESATGLRIRSARSPRLKGRLLPYSKTTMVAKWDDRSYDADVFVNFTLDKNDEPTRMTMSYIAPVTDFSFDFHDLDFEKVRD